MGAPLAVCFLLLPHHPSLALSSVSLCICVHVPLPLPLISPFPPTRCPPAPLALAPLTQQSLKEDSRPLEGSPTQLPILADMLLYYCRFAARPVLLQVYQTEVSALPPQPLAPSDSRGASLTSPGPSLGPVPTPWQPSALSLRSQWVPAGVHTDAGLALCS